MPLGDVTKIFMKGLDAVSPASMVHRHVKRLGDVLVVGDRSYELDKNIHVIGFGKAVAGMCRAVQDILKDHIVGGILSVPTGLSESLQQANKSYMLPREDGKIIVHEGAKDNLPDEKSYNATLQIIKMLKNTTKKDIVLTLLSGGGSALLCAPLPPLSMQDKLNVTKLLMKSGASIDELNTVRKSLSAVKGGKLAEMAHPSEMITLILSDIIGDPLNLIASGPTVKRDDEGNWKCLTILQKYGLLQNASQQVKKILSRTEDSDKFAGLASFPHVQNVLVGTNTIAVDAALAEAQKLGYCSFVVSKRVDGEARHVGTMVAGLGFALADLIGDIEKGAATFPGENQFLKRYFSDVLNSPVFDHEPPWRQDFYSFLERLLAAANAGRSVRSLKRLCIIFAGETTVALKGDGIGGRNQEMVLGAAIQYQKIANKINPPNSESAPGFLLAFLSAGTDGQDGPTDAAGAVFDNGKNNFVETETNLDLAEQALANNDSYSFLSRFPQALLKTGLSGTNVMDIQVLTVEL